MYYCYIVQCSDNSLYCGSTTDLLRRLSEHNTSKTKSAKYTRGRRPVTLVYAKKHKTVSSAKKHEAQIKRMTRFQKLELINSSTLV